MTYNGNPPFVTSSATSQAASQSIHPFVNQMQWDVIGALDAAYPNGVTCDEVEIALHMKHQTASARIRELVLKGFVEDSGKERPTRSGCAAVVYVRTSRLLPLRTSVRVKRPDLATLYAFLGFMEQLWRAGVPCPQCVIDICRWVQAEIDR